MFQILNGNAFFHCHEGDVICTTTNGQCKKDGNAVMGAGNAKFVKETFPGVDRKLGDLLKTHGNRAFRLGNYQYKGKGIVLATFPTKNKWEDDSDLDLIETSASQLLEMANKFGWKKIYVPIPGCGNGNLKWSMVKPKLAKLDERFIVFSKNGNQFND